MIEKTRLFEWKRRVFLYVIGGCAAVQSGTSLLRR